MFAVLALAALMLFTWAVAVAATYAEDETSAESKEQKEKRDQPAQRRIRAA